MNPVQTVTITFTVDGLNVVLEHLAQGRFALVNDLINDVRSQAMKQLNPEPAVDAVEVPNE